MGRNLNALKTALDNNGIKAEINDEASGVHVMASDTDELNKICEVVLGKPVYPKVSERDNYDYTVYLH